MKQPALSHTTTRCVGSGLSTGGLLLACVCFFLPLYRSCNSDVAPVDEDLDMIFTMLNPYLLAYALAGLLLLGAVLHRRRWRRVVGILILILCIVFLAANASLFSYAAIKKWELVETLWFPAILFVNAGLVGGSVLMIARRKAWRRRTVVPWSGLVVCLPATAWFVLWEVLGSFDALYGMHLTVLGFATATAGFLLLLLHHRSARRWTRLRWHRSRLRAYHLALETTIARSATIAKTERE